MKKSVGHICFAFEDKVEFYAHDGEVYRANTDNPLQTDGRRHGRWECSREHFDRFRDVIVGGSA